MKKEKKKAQEVNTEPKKTAKRTRRSRKGADIYSGGMLADYVDDAILPFGMTVRVKREIRNMTLAALAKILGISVSFLSSIERGEKMPDVPLVNAIAEELDLDPVVLFKKATLASGKLEIPTSNLTHEEVADLIEKTKEFFIPGG